MKDILLINLPPYLVQMPPLSVYCLAEYLKKYGFKCDVWDLNIELYRFINNPHWWYQKRLSQWQAEFEKRRFYLIPFFKKLKTELQKQKYAYIGISLNKFSWPWAVSLSIFIKNNFPSIKLIWGGTGLETIPVLKIKSLANKLPADYLVIGEGEKKLHFLLKKRKNKLTKIINKQELLTAEKIPLPILKKKVLHRYVRDNLLGYPYPVMISRGCKWNCAYCSEPSRWQRTFRVKKVEDVLDFISFIYKKKKVNWIWFAENSLNQEYAWFKKLISFKAKRLPKQKWMSSLMLTSYLEKDEIMDLLAESGCKAINFSVDTASNKLLRFIGKPYNSAMAENILKKAKARGIKTIVSFIVGLPMEDEREFKETKMFIKRNHFYIDRVSYCNPCFLLKKSLFVLNQEKYKISQYKNELEWEDNLGNNFFIRKQRQQELLNLFKGYNIKVEWKQII